MKTPRELADTLLVLAEESSRLGGELAEIETRKPQQWLKIRTRYESDRATDRAWEMTEDGAREIVIRARLKANDRTSASIRTKLRVLENEAKNLY